VEGQYNKNMSVNKSFVFSAVLMSLTVGSSLILSSSRALADDSVVDVVRITVPVSCSLTSTGNTSHTSSINNGTYVSDIGTTYLEVYCNDEDGFSIYAVGYTDNEYGKTVLTSPLGSSNDIVTGTATAAGSTDVSNWAMKLTTTTSPTPEFPISIENSFDNYHVVPATYTLVATRASGTDVGQSAVGSYLTSTYAVYVSKRQPSATYTGKVKYTLVHPATEVPAHPETTQAGKICYYANGPNVLGSMGCQNVSTSATNATLLASNFSREGYGFAGWSTTFDYSDSEGFYGPQEYITFTAGTYTGSNPGLSLYAHWIKSAGSLQDWSGCSTLQTGAITALTDQRDNETYAVAKLADGNCWMIENMRLENTDTTSATNIALAQGYETGFTGLANPEAPWSADTTYTTANSLYSIDGSTANTISGNDPAYRFPRYNNVNTPTALNVSDRPSTPNTNDATNSTSNAGMYSYGNYYTWAAAAANTTSTSSNVKSICPKGWSLPRGGNKSRENTSDFWKLIVTGLNNGTKPANYDSSTVPYYTGSTEGTPVSNALRAYPNNFVYSGLISGGSVNDRGSYGLYWSSTTNGSSFAYGLYFLSYVVRPGNNSNSKAHGCSIRCIAPSV